MMRGKIKEENNEREEARRGGTPTHTVHDANEMSWAARVTQTVH